MIYQLDSGVIDVIVLILKLESIPLITIVFKIIPEPYNEL